MSLIRSIRNGRPVNGSTSTGPRRAFGGGIVRQASPSNTRPSRRGGCSRCGGR